MYTAKKSVQRYTVAKRCWSEFRHEEPGGKLRGKTFSKAVSPTTKHRKKAIRGLFVDKRCLKLGLKTLSGGRQGWHIKILL